jgi:hypothetical protein
MAEGFAFRVGKEHATMKRLIVVLAAVMISATAVYGQDPGWPRQLTKQGSTLVYYQPQVDDWKNFQELDWRMAISITPAGGKAVVGALAMHGWTSVNSDTQMVLISNMTLKNSYFPSLDPASAASMDQLVRTFVPPTVWISMHRLVACVPKPQTSPPGVQLNNDPPQTFVSYRPAILLSVEGQPVLADIPDSKLQYVVNTEWALFLYEKSSYYLLAGERWLTSKSLDGPWSPTVTLPKEMNKLPKEQQWEGLKTFIPPPPESSSAVVPTVFYSTVPAVVILFDGQPVYSAIRGTQLAYATNTVSYIFVYSPTSQYYYLTAGRWFTSTSLKGPWTFATPNLPPDFAHIPPDSPASQVLSSVPGTEEAKDSVMIAQVPTTVTVDAAAVAAKASVTYAGAPQFVPIQGTSMFYATNTAQKVIQVGDLYYLCLQGIWFVSATPQGPWQTADSVPQVIYTIPASSPVYNVTYVTQVVAPGGTVQASYTAGYMGAFIVGAAVGAIVAGGTGYYYPPYIYHPAYGYPAYYGYPHTYGYSSYYHTTTGAYGVSQTAYGPYGSATRSASYNPYTGTSTHSASVSTPYGSAHAATAYNPYTGASAATHQGSNGYSSWGSSAVSKNGESAYSQHYTTAQGTTGSVQTSAGGKAVGASGANGNSAAAGKTANGNMYASADGNVYKNTGSGWEKYGSNGSWNSVNSSSAQQHEQTQSSQQHPTSTSSASSYQQHPTSTSSASSYQHPSSGGETQGMQQEAQNRQRGEQSSQHYQQQRSSSGGGGRGRR